VTLGVGLIGCGFIGRFHSAAIRHVTTRGLVDARYVAVCHVDAARARSFAEAAGVERALADPNQLIDSPDIDIVYVCVPTAMHKSLVLRAVERGKHVFCEKPLATNLADVEEMVEAVAAAGERELVGAGTLLEHSIHDIDLLRWFCGEIATVRGSVRNFAGHEGVEDLAIAHLEFAGGGQAELVSVWHSVIGRPSARRLELFFENGFFHIENDFLGPINFQVHANIPEVISEEEVRSRYRSSLGLNIPDFDRALRYSLEDYFFLKTVTAGADPFPDFATALAAHRVVDAVYESARRGGEVVNLTAS